MQWVVDLLKKGETVTFRPRGNSMVPLIKSGQEVTVSAWTNIEGQPPLEVGTIVLCKVKSNIYLHKIYAISAKDGYLIGNNKGFKNGWTKCIYGVLVSK
jgi:hypothetical protein